jgi:hypothetical protein
LVDDSIDTYIIEHLELDYSLIQSKLENSQIGKKFMLWKGNRFYMDYLRDEEVKIKKLITLKKNKNINTVVLKTDCNTEYHMLLRWKNRLGILYPDPTQFKQSDCGHLQFFLITFNVPEIYSFIVVFAKSDNSA